MTGSVSSKGLPTPVGTVGRARTDRLGRGLELYARAAGAAGGMRPVSFSPDAPPRSAFDGIIEAAARRQGLDAPLVKAVVEAESGFNPLAVSRAGAKGLMQLMDGTARSLGVRDPFDPVASVEGGTRLLRSLLDRFGSLPLALAAYNAGTGAVERFGGIPPFQETRTYVERVLALQKRYQAAAGIGTAEGGEGVGRTTG